jgi:hypothetical protein
VGQGKRDLVVHGSVGSPTGFGTATGDVWNHLIGFVIG